MNAIKVYMFNKLIGVLSKNENNPLYYDFKYDNEFIKSKIEVCPIMMPLSNNIYTFTDLSYETFKGLPTLIADSLPDNYGSILLDIWMKKNNKENLDAFEILSYIGKRGMGALEFVPAIENDEISDLVIDDLVKLAKEILENRTRDIIYKDDVNLEKLIDVGSSIGGARAKAVIAIDQNGNIKSGQISGLKNYEYYILKFDGVSSSDSNDYNNNYFTRIEYLYYLMAKDLNIDMMESKLYINNNLYHFMTKRFDRDEFGKKIHVLSLAGMVGFDYKEVGAHSYEEVALIIKTLKCDFADVLELYRRMVFNVVFRNNDDHVKNISFIMNKKGEWRLSPAYDITYSYKPSGLWTNHHQLRLNNKIDDITYDDLLISAKNMGINEKDAIEIINNTINVSENVYNYADKAYLPKNIIAFLKDKFVKF